MIPADRRRVQRHGGKERQRDLRGCSAGFVVADNRLYLTANARSVFFELEEESGWEEAGTTGDGSVRAPMPGQATAILIAEGDEVDKGQILVRIEAMKMEHSLTAPGPGRIENVRCTVGQQVNEGDELLAVS